MCFLIKKLQRLDLNDNYAFFSENGVDDGKLPFSWLDESVKGINSK